MKILNEIEYQFKKIKDKWLFFHFYLNKIETPKKSVSKTILIIRLDAIGDCIVWLDQAKEYRKTFPNHKLVLLYNDAWSELAEKMTYFDEIIPFNRGKIGVKKYYKQLVSSLNKYNYEKVYSPVFSRDFITVDWIVHNVNSQEKIGYEGDYQNNNNIVTFNFYYRKNSNNINLKKIADSWYSTLVPNSEYCKMELQRNAHFVRHTINPLFQSHLPKIPFKPHRSSIIPDKKYAVLFLGAGIIQRTWPVEYFVEISYNVPFENIVLCGSSNDHILVSEFISLYQGNKNIIDLTGKTSLLELINIIAFAEVVITNETSASHISVATRTPSICLLGGGHYGRFLPYQVDIIDESDFNNNSIIVTCKDHTCFGCNWKCKYPYEHLRWKCIATIKKEDVNNALMQFINMTSY